MSYQLYPGPAGARSQFLAKLDPGKPTSLRIAVLVMWAGAAAAAIGTVVSIAVGSKIRASIVNAFLRGNSFVRPQSASHGGYTVAQVHTIATVTFVAFVVAGVISVLLWAFMAWANNRGSGWARIFASVLFGLISVEVLLSLTPGEGLSHPHRTGMADRADRHRVSMAARDDAIHRPGVTIGVRYAHLLAGRIAGLATIAVMGFACRVLAMRSS